jgi:hypothetical protein
MSVIHTNNITNKDGTSGPTISGITTVNSSGFMRVPVGDTFRWMIDENVIKDGLILYLDAGNKLSYSGSGTTWRDFSGFENNGVINGANFNSSGYFEFTSTSDNIELGATNKFAGNNITVEVWVYPTSSNGNYIWGNYDGGGYVNGDFMLRFDPVGSSAERRPLLQIGTGSNIGSQFISTTQYDYDNWYHIVCTWDGTTGLIYINGSNQATTRLNGGTGASGTAANNTSPFYIGTGPPLNDSVNGNYGQFRIYNKTLSAAEVLQNYNALKYRYGL